MGDDAVIDEVIDDVDTDKVIFFSLNPKRFVCLVQLSL